MGEKQSNRIDISGMGYHLESLKDFKGSFYKNVYQEAYLRIHDIIISAQKYEEMQYKKIPTSVQAFFPNIITFIGARGGGKTSVMLSLMSALKEYQKDSRLQEDFYSFKEQKNIVFTCLDCIDGSLMEHGEDVFKTILAQMYRKFTDLETEGGIYKSSDFDFRKRELLKGFENVYRTVCDIENMGSEQPKAGEAYMSSLQSFSSSQKVRKDFVELINKFTDLMKYNQHERYELGMEHYVVIAIDDIDLNIQNSFSMLEKIHRYCTVPNVIVLLTLDIQQMLSIVTQHFYGVVPKVNKLLINQELYVRKLSIDYLEKALPVNYRIYIPKVSQNVVIGKENKNVKSTILSKLYRCSGVCFDSQGLKRHFYVPSSMRGFAGFYLMLNSMEEMQDAHLTDGNQYSEEKATAYENTFEENYEILLSDLENRMILEKLYKREDIQFFRDVMRSDIRRAMANVKEYFENCENRTGGREDYDVTYGELVETLYEMGRIKNGYYKPMVHCLLAYFSYAFTRQYINEKFSWYKKEDDRNRITERIVGGHILEAWSEKLIPHIGVASPDEQGTTESSSGKNSGAGINPKAMGCVRGVRLDSVLTIPVDRSVLEGLTKNENREKLARLIKQIELMSLFFTEFTFSRKTEDNYPWKFKITDSSPGVLTLGYDNNRKEELLSGCADFNVLNVIRNSMYASKRLECVEKALIDAVKDFIGNGNKTRNVISKLKKAIAECSLTEEYKKWEKEFGGPLMPLPLWWFDFSYNILKRTKRTMEKKNPVTVTDVNEMYAYTKGLYVCILEHISEQARFYGDCLEEECELKIVDQFKECPGIKEFFNTNENENKNENVSDMQKAMDRLFNRLKNSYSEE